MFSKMFDEILKELLEKDCDMYIKTSTADTESFLKNSIGWKFIGKLPLVYIGNIGCYTIEAGKVMWLKKFYINIISLGNELLVFVDPTCPEVYGLEDYTEITTRLLDVFNNALKVNLGDILKLGNQGTSFSFDYYQQYQQNYYGPAVFGTPPNYYAYQTCKFDLSDSTVSTNLEDV